MRRSSSSESLHHETIYACIYQDIRSHKLENDLLFDKKYDNYAMINFITSRNINKIINGEDVTKVNDVQTNLNRAVNVRLICEVEVSFTKTIVSVMIKGVFTGIINMQHDNIVYTIPVKNGNIHGYMCYFDNNRVSQRVRHFMYGVESDEDKERNLCAII